MAEFRMEKRNKLRQIFGPTPEERTEQLARMKKIFDEAAVDEGCATCEYCVENKDLPYYPNFVDVERSKCLKGLKCDTVLFSVKHCPKYKKGTP